MKQAKLFLVLLELFLEVAGFGLLWYLTDWKVALSIFMIIWGTTIGIKRHIK